MTTLAEAISHPSPTTSNMAFSTEWYGRELERVFGRTWLFVGHESLLPNVSDYITSYMGQDPVIVQRGRDGRIRVFLNRCRHRGNLLCVSTANQQAFVCSYHAWTYADGKCIGVSRSRDAYCGEIDKSNLGLVEARTQIYVASSLRVGIPVWNCWTTTSVTQSGGLIIFS